ncbi:MAG: spermidine synthase [Planctomycetales bacterium]
MARLDLWNSKSIGRDAMLRQGMMCCVRGLVRPGFQQGVCAGLAAMCLATICQQAVVALGSSTAVLWSLCAAVALGLATGTLGSSRAVSAAGLAPLIWPLGLAAWLVASPQCLQLADWLISQPKLVDPRATLRGLGLTLGLSCALVGIPAALGARVLRVIAANYPSPAHAGASLVGAATGLAIWCLGLAQVLGPWFCGSTAAGTLLLAIVWQMLRTSSGSVGEGASSTAGPSAPPSVSAASDRGRTDVVSPGESRAGWILNLLQVALAAGLGGLLASCGRVLEQLFPDTAYLACAQVAGLLAGAGVGWLAYESRWPARWSSASWRLATGLGAGLGGVLLLAAFPGMVRGALWLNAHVATPQWLLMGRGAIAALAIAPIGLAAAGWLACRSKSDRVRQRPALRYWLVGLAAGYCLLAPVGERGISPDIAIVGSAWCVALAGAMAFFWTGGRFSQRRERWLAAAAAVVLVAAPLWRGECDSRLAAKLLFNTNVFVGYRMGYAMDQLPYLDEGRHLATLHGARATTTVWKFGQQIQIRENGIPTGAVGCDPRVFPRMIAETLPAALPLILHEKPQSLLLLGIGSGEGLSAGLQFPLPEVACWEQDACRLRVLREVVSPLTGDSPLDDDRVRMTHADPALALDADPGLYDVVVSSPDHLALLRAQSSLTQSFYRRAARRLSPAGIFCQRLQCIDLGPQPLQVMVRTMQSVFRDVLAMEVGAGELLLVATNDPRGLVRPNLVQRLELPHVRKLLAQSGADWSALLNVTTYRNEALAKFASAGSRSVNGADNSRLALSLPSEVMRWASKVQEVQTALQPGAGRLANSIENEEAAALLLRRLAEVAGQQNLMSGYTEQYWAYRATLRTQITQKPRSKIQQVSATGEKQELHPEDRRRLHYFTALGRAVKTHNPIDIQRVARFETPYDPLLSYFVHLEAAELYARAEERDVKSELQHRLHAVWFSSPRDASLHNVVTALELLREYPGVESDDAHRWDLINSLLQALQQRWEARAGTKPSDVKKAIADIDLTVAAAEKTFEIMPRLSRDAGVSPEAWELRRSVLEKTLLRPVKGYRSDLLPQLHRKEARREKAGGGEEVEEEK